MQDYLFQHLYGDGHKGFLNYGSTVLINKTDPFEPKKEEIIGQEL